MPLQNRVDPFSQLLVISEKRRWMDNRQRLHDADKKITPQSEFQLWTTCESYLKGRKHELIALNSYTTLFFFHEATVSATCHHSLRKGVATFKNRRTRIEKFLKKLDFGASLSVF